MRDSIRAAIDRARCDPNNIRAKRSAVAKRVWRENEETYRRCMAERDERRRARKMAGQDPTQSPDYVMHDEAERDSVPSRDETTPYPHEPGYHLTVNGETTVFVDYSAALYKFVEVLNGSLESGLKVKMDLVGPEVTMGFMFERTKPVPSPAVDAEGRG